jgi:mercuric ion transport protein
MRVARAASASPARPGAATGRPSGHQQRLLGYLSLFTSVGTLLCCALPSLLVLLGFGATVASVLATAPWLVALSRHKAWVFGTSAILIAATFYYVYRLAPRLVARNLGCAVDDPACARATRASRSLLWTSALLLLIGITVAYVLPVVLEYSAA